MVSLFSKFKDSVVTKQHPVEEQCQVLSQGDNTKQLCTSWQLMPLGNAKRQLLMMRHSIVNKDEHPVVNDDGLLGV